MTAFSLIKALRENQPIENLKNAIEQGTANVHEQDENKISVLVYAIEWKMNDLVQYLIEKGAELNAVTFYVSAMTWNYDLVKLHLEKGLPADTSYAGYTPLNCALASLDRLMKSPAYPNLEKIFDLLVESGADVNTQNEEQLQAPLHFAAHYGQHNLAQKLISKGAAIDITDKHGLTPLHHASMGNCDTYVIQVLIKAGADINVQDPHYGRTPLHEAVLCYHYDAVCVLKALGADKSIGLNKAMPFKNKKPFFDVILPAGSTPLSIANTLQMYELVDVLAD